MSIRKSDRIISVEHVSKYFGEKAVLNDVNLQVRKGEFVTILGPSGCGKTTLLRLIAGFQTASEGVITMSGKEITQTPPHKRPVNTVFQKYALFPHLNVYNNIAFGLKLKKLPSATIEKKVQQALKMVGLTDYEDLDVDSLSGGQQQRVAIARAIVNEPEVLLLDEPLAALDLKMRKDMQMELKEMHKSLGITFVYVTHDQEEALTLSDTIVVMSEGKIQQIGTPIDIYNEPVNSFVADFIGESNILNGTMIKDWQVSFAGHEFECVDEGFGEQMPVDVVLRPEDIYIFEPSEAAMLTSSTGRPSSRAWTISLKNSRISADSSVHSAQDQDQYRHAAVQIFCRRVKPAAQRAPPGQIHLNQAVLLFQHPVEDHPRQQRADGTGVDGADIHPAGDDALDAQPHGQAHDADHRHSSPPSEV